MISSKASKRKTDQFYSDSKSEPNNLCIPRADIDYGSYRRVAGKRSVPDPAERLIVMPAEGWADNREVGVPWIWLNHPTYTAQEEPWLRLKKEQPTNPESTPWIRLKKNNVHLSHSPWTWLKRKPAKEDGKARSYLSRMGRSSDLGGPGRSSYLIRMGRSTGGLEDSKLELPEPEPLA